MWNVKRSILYQTTMWSKKLIKRISQHEKQWWSMFQMVSYSTFKPSRTMSSVNRKTDKTTCWKIELLSYHITRVSVKHFNKIEKKNNINVNIFSYEEKKSFPIYIISHYFTTNSCNIKWKQSEIKTTNLEVMRYKKYLWAVLMTNVTFTIMV